MIFILLSVIQSTLIFITFRLFERYRVDNWQALTVNYLVAAFLGFITGNVAKDMPGVLQAGWLPYSLLLGLMFVGTFFLFALSCQKAGIAITSVTSKMSVVIPVLSGFLLYSESLGLARIAGIIIALSAFYMVFLKDKRTRTEKKWAFLPVLVFLGNGLVDSGMKYSQHHFVIDSPIPFLTFTFASAMIVAIFVSVIRHFRGHAFNPEGIVGGIILGALNFGSTYFVFRALETSESSVVFPVANSAIVGLSTLTGYFWFREKLSPINWAGVLLSIIAILIIAIA